MKATQMSQTTTSPQNPNTKINYHKKKLRENRIGELIGDSGLGRCHAK